MMVSVLIDWITVTQRDWERYEHLTPLVINRCLGENPTPDKHRTGARGWRGEKSFVGQFDNGMLIVEATGCNAQVVADRVSEVLPEDGLSVARLDLQATIWVADADAVVTTIVPSRRYKCSLTRSIYERGSTLYVGAPASDARLRVYNKTAESGLAPADGGEWLRIELQIRNKFADRAWRSWRKRAHGGFFLEYVRKMLDERTYRMVRDAVVHGDEPVFDEDTDDDWVTRRVYWMRYTVIPALRRLALHNELTRREVGLAMCAIMSVSSGDLCIGSDLEVRKEVNSHDGDGHCERRTFHSACLQKVWG